MSRYIDIEPYEKDGWYLQKHYHNSYGEVIKTTPLVSVPTADAKPIKHGRWITVSDGYGNGVATASICECSLCKDTIWVYKNDERKWKYCPNCGAKMDGGENG